MFKNRNIDNLLLKDLSVFNKLSLLLIAHAIDAVPDKTTHRMVNTITLIDHCKTLLANL